MSVGVGCRRVVRAPLLDHIVHLLCLPPFCSCILTLTLTPPIMLPHAVLRCVRCCRCQRSVGGGPPPRPHRRGWWGGNHTSWWGASQAILPDLLPFHLSQQPQEKEKVEKEEVQKEVQHPTYPPRDTQFCYLWLCLLAAAFSSSSSSSVSLLTPSWTVNVRVSHPVIDITPPPTPAHNEEDMLSNSAREKITGALDAGSWSFEGVID